jgi:hypothetical protein
MWNATPHCVFFLELGHAPTPSQNRDGVHVINVASSITKYPNLHTGSQKARAHMRKQGLPPTT